MTLVLETFKLMWVLYRRRIRDGDVKAIGVFHTQREGRKMIEERKRNGFDLHNLNNRYSLKRKLFRARYKQ